MKVKVEAGQWYRNRAKLIRYVVGVGPLMGKPKEDRYPFLVIGDATGVDIFWCSEDGKCYDDESDEDLVEHLTDCTGFDWEPEKHFDPPKGFRLLETGEEIENGDYYLDNYEKEIWVPLLFNATSVGMKWRRGKHCPYARKIEPKYRPFANKAEAKPFVNEWLIDEDEDETRIIGFRKTGIQTWRGYYSWANACQKLTKPDGTPFGVLVEE